MLGFIRQDAGRYAANRLLQSPRRQLAVANLQRPTPTDSRPIMYPVIPTELMQSAVQLVVYFVTIFGAVFGLMLCSRT
jgi:hypothetical protein